MMTDAAPAARRTPTWRRLLPLAAILGLIVLAFALGLDDHLSFDALRANRSALLALVAERPALTAVGFVLAYAAAVALSLPGALILTLGGGFLFGSALATVLVVIGATLGACAIFLIARSALGDLLRAKAGPWLGRMEAGFRRNALSYLLVLRLIPIFPFWLVNLVPAFLGVPLGTFALATFVGIIPGSLVYASVGAGLGAVFEQGATPDLGIILEPQILLPLIGLALLALLPLAYRRWRGDAAA